MTNSCAALPLLADYNLQRSASKTVQILPRHWNLLERPRHPQPQWPCTTARCVCHELEHGERPAGPPQNSSVARYPRTTPCSSQERICGTLSASDARARISDVNGLREWDHSGCAHPGPDPRADPPTSTRAVQGVSRDLELGAS